MCQLLGAHHAACLGKMTPCTRRQADCSNALLCCADLQLTSLDLSGLAAVSDALAPNLVALTRLVVLQLNHTSCGDSTVEWLTYGNRLHQWTAAARRQHSTAGLAAAQHTATGVAAAPMGVGVGDTLGSQSWPRCGADNCLHQVFVFFLCATLHNRSLISCISLMSCLCTPDPGPLIACHQQAGVCSPAHTSTLSTGFCRVRLTAAFWLLSRMRGSGTDRLALHCVCVTPADLQDQDQLLAPRIHPSDTCCCGPARQLP